MEKVDWLEREISDISNQKAYPKNLIEKVREIIYANYFRELEAPPRIAVIGKAGVGKSSTINSLFKTNLKIGHTRRGTYQYKKINVKPDGQLVSGERGNIIVYDMPGLGDDIYLDQKTIAVYREVLAQSDVAIWVVSAIDRSLAHDQILLGEIIRDANPDLFSRLVIGVNKLDLVHPDNWNRRINLPSTKQDKNFPKVLSWVHKSFVKVCPDLTLDRIVGYSAVRHYNLTYLFKVMLDAAPDDRAWLLNERKSISNFMELVKLTPEMLSNNPNIPEKESVYGV